MRLLSLIETSNNFCRLIENGHGRTIVIVNVTASENRRKSSSGFKIWFKLPNDCFLDIFLNTFVITVIHLKSLIDRFCSILAL